MTIWALIPIKEQGRGKTRLAPVLSPQERDELVEAMLGRVTAATQAVVARTILLGPARGHFAAITDTGDGLNAALDKALASIVNGGSAPARLLVIAGDLPTLTADEVRTLAALPAGTIGIATDRHSTGTNALSLPLPEAAGFRFHYGTSSAALHRKAAQALGLNAVTITLPGLAKDIDDPSDLKDAELTFALAN
ncbi:2-phospho-L-lactate guanylyltransferase [Novosphingobium guangzhouense]|uniref:2-phospho-L-lactate guanylyltransferase n=1 Tax=Novosphingobium guangzhouense TaxID=1850347 RepID=A0A2K2G434_9SPHN|nr:2-phospho-L-lactate guanylyltransferase [Novosphingobium guangzhouense]PNU05787.1 2-phospho-L-lactate guanylyltransferase [Novosphingobium guangzhouense]